VLFFLYTPIYGVQKNTVSTSERVASNDRTFSE